MLSTPGTSQRFGIASVGLQPGHFCLAHALLHRAVDEASGRRRVNPFSLCNFLGGRRRQAVPDGAPAWQAAMLNQLMPYRQAALPPLIRLHRQDLRDR